MQAMELEDLFDLYKVCRKCSQSLPVGSFHKRKKFKDGLNNICKDCYNFGQNEWRKDNPVKTKQYRRTSNLRHFYGMSNKEYNLKYEQQNGCCAICDKHQSEINLALAVDHDHRDGTIRDLLCNNCNLGIGNFQDNPDLMMKAIKYLEHHKERRRERSQDIQERSE
jgi:hypothetical protein